MAEADVPSGPTTFQQKFKALRSAIDAVILGQESVVDDLVVAALARGHVLVEGEIGRASCRERV